MNRMGLSVKKERMMRNTDGIFLVAWAVFFLSLLFRETIIYAKEDLSEGSAVVLGIQWIRYGSYALALFAIFQKQMRKRDLLSAALIVGVLGISMLFSGNRTLFFYALFLVAAYGTDARFLIRFSMVLQGVFLGLILFLSSAGIVEDYIFGAERMRHGLGFTWVTVAPILFLFWMLQYIYVRRERIRFFEYVLMELGSFALFLLTNTRMAFFVSSLFLFYFMIERYLEKPFRFLREHRTAVVWLPLIIALFAIALHLFYAEENGLFAALNKLMSNRLSLGKAAIREYGFTLFGQKIEWVGFSFKEIHVDKGPYLYVDSSYLQIALAYGLATLASVLFLYMSAIRKAYRAGDFYLVSVLIIILLFSVTEPRLLHFAFNPFPLLAFAEIGTVEKESPRTLFIRNKLRFREVRHRFIW